MQTTAASAPPLASISIDIGKDISHLVRPEGKIAFGPCRARVRICRPKFGRDDVEGPRV
jgi:hypothetical protein